MVKNLKAIKSSLIIGILLVSIFVILIPSSSVGLGLFNAEPDVVMSADTNSTDVHFKPVGGYYNVPLEIKYSILATFPNIIVTAFNERQNAIIHLSVEPMQDWFTCTLSHNSVRTDITTKYEPVEEKVTVRINLDERAPARGSGEVRVTARVDTQKSLGCEIAGKTFEYTFPFTPKYLPVISVESSNTFVDIGPMETAEIEVVLRNLGNARTTVNIDILNIPEGWAVGAPAQVTIGSSTLDEDPTTTVNIQIQPPYGFGYHDDRMPIQIEFTPSFYLEPGQPEASGAPIKETFNIQSRGFSTPGFEMIFVLIGLIVIAFIIRFEKLRKKK